MRFHDAYRRWIDSGPFEDFREQLCLSLTMWVRYRVRGTALVHFYPFDDTVDSIVLGLGVGEPLQYEDSTTFRPTVSICSNVKWFACAIRAEKMSTSEAKVHLKRSKSEANRDLRKVIRLTSGEHITLTPPATAAVQSPF